MTQDTTATTPVITLWETYGSGMEAIARALSARLDLDLVQQAFTSEELDDQIEKRDNPLLDRVLEILGKASLNAHQTTTAGGFVQSLRDNEELARENTAAVLAQAESGGIIMGRSATKILAGRPGTLHVKLDGPVEDRIARAVEVFGITPEVARRRQRVEDDARTRMSIEIYDWNPMNNEDFDLVINTSTNTPEQTVEIIVAAMRAREITA